MSKYLEFKQIGDTGVTEIWEVLSTSFGYSLGKIKWYAPWRQYTFFPTSETVFSAGCLGDIIKKISELTAKRGSGGAK
jgi:hypothetical protein